ncbi:hypothetical protein IM538_05930 [Cytobacillus suaedae]|nr:hypothetical protein IM538_05930 [Cytobacillus suaedae]
MIFKKVYGIQLWKLNLRFKRLGLSRGWVEEIKNGVIHFDLDPIETDKYLSPEVQDEINEIINELEGVETFRLCIFKECKIQYKEQLTHNALSRWIEISIIEDKQKLIS